jgi:hypothetical protein
VALLGSLSELKISPDRELSRLCPESYIVEADFCYKMFDAPTGKWKDSDEAFAVSSHRWGNTSIPA